MAEIIDVKRLVATVSVPADEATQLRPGQAADIFAEQTIQRIAVLPD